MDQTKDKDLAKATEDQCGTQLNVEKVFSMNCGQGELSYTQNSRYQEGCLLLLQTFLEECIREMRLIPCESFCIADMGCSVGANTLLVAETISQAVGNKYSSSSSSVPMPDLHVFFQDLPSNDFNSLLQHVHNNNSASKSSKYFAAAVAGSFYRRLFPKRSLHFVHSSNGLHWLSRVPPEVEDRNSRCWNREGMLISKGSAAEVAGAYLRQFQEDFGSFLRARGEEVVEGGRMFMLFSGREGCDPRDQGVLGLMAEMLNSALDDVVALDRRAVEKFNLPCYSPCADEVRCEVEKEGSFRVMRIQFVKSGFVRAVDSGFGRRNAKEARAVVEPLLASHFGRGVVDAVFERYAVRAQEKASSLSIRGSEAGSIVALLERTSTPSMP